MADQSHTSEQIVSSTEFKPFIPASESLVEFSAKAIIAGMFFGVIFGAANAYLGLRAGLTISTSIPIAVMTVASLRIFRGLGGTGTILEANTSQTIGSASSSVASGIIFTLPAMFLWGLPPGVEQMILLGLCGGLLGVLFMIPLRQFLIEQEHDSLPYPEGTACASVLIASEKGGSNAKNVFLGLGVGALFKFLIGGLKLVKEKIAFPIPFLKKGEIGVEISAALLGVGYILGPRISSIMVAGGLLSCCVIIPGIAYWGEGKIEPVYPGESPIDDLTVKQLHSTYVRYIGAGAVAAAGLMTLIKSIPTMLASFAIGAGQLRQQMSGDEKAADSRPRTSQDLPLKYVAIGVVFIALVMTIVPTVFGVIDSIGIRMIAAGLVILCSFFFVTVASRIVGLVGVTSNPVSGMTIASLLLSSLVFLAMGWTGDAGRIAALSVGCVVAIAASISGDTSQDLKTGFLLGATPKRQQVGELLGVLSSTTFVCLTVRYLCTTYEIGGEEIPAPQATLMRLVIDGVLQQSLPWGLIGFGASLAVVIELCRLPSLAFAVGVYLPITTMTPVFIGGMVRALIEKRAAGNQSRIESGVLFGSGLVGGEGLLGVGIAFVAYQFGKEAMSGIGHEWAGNADSVVSTLALCALVSFFFLVARKRATDK